MSGLGLANDAEWLSGPVEGGLNPLHELRHPVPWGITPEISGGAQETLMPFFIESQDG